MRIRVFMLAVVAVLVTAGPALAQSAGAGDDGSSNARAEGSSVSAGTSSSSAAVNTTGGSNVGVVQGNVAEGSTGSTSGNDGDQSGAANSGGAGSGQTVGSADAPNAAKDGVLRRLDLPAIGTARDATPASSSGGSNVFLWAAAGVIVVGLALAYRRLPRPTSA